MGKAKRKVSLLEFAFTEREPRPLPRIPYYWMTDDELHSIKEFPYITEERCPFEFAVRVGEEVFKFNGAIPKGFPYNCADIPFLLQPISYDKHSPFVIQGSLIHDYLLSRKRILYTDWEMEEKGITPLEFKKITSEIFGYVLRYNGVPYRKARLMAKMVDLFQYLIPRWYSLTIKEFEV